MADVPINQVELEFADGQYLFRLNLPQINELQIKTGVGIGALFARVIAGRYGMKGEIGQPAEAQFYAADLNDTIRLGLIGGGQGLVDGEEVSVSPLRANQLVEAYVSPMPYGERWTLAAAILVACIEGYKPAKEPPPPKKPRPARKAASTSPAP